MAISQELKKVIRESHLNNVEAITSFFKDQLENNLTKIEYQFIQNAIKEINKHDSDYNVFLNEEGIFYFYERKE